MSFVSAMAAPKLRSIVAGCRIISRRGYSTDSPQNTLVLRKDIPTHHNSIIRVLTLNSPSNRNAISRQLLDELQKEVWLIGPNNRALNRKLVVAGGMPMGNGTSSEASSHPRTSEFTDRRISALVIGSAVPEAFSSGADLKERIGMSEEQ